MLEQPFAGAMRVGERRLDDDVAQTLGDARIAFNAALAKGASVLAGANAEIAAANETPFGGVKESGYGREGSPHGLDDDLHTKYLCQGQLD